MSHYSKLTSAITDKRALVKALCRMPNRNRQLTEANIEVCDSARHLQGYMNDTRPEVANVIVRRQHVGSLSNDIGFALEDGVYKPIISQYDSNFYNEEWIAKLETFAAIEKAKLEMDEKGIEYTEGLDEERNPTIEARFPLENEERFTA